MKSFGNWFQQLGFSGGLLGVGLIFATSSGTAWSASSVPVDSGSSQPNFGVENRHNEKMKIFLLRLRTLDSGLWTIFNMPHRHNEKMISQTESNPANPPAPRSPTTTNPKEGEVLDLSPKIIEDSPVLQRWLRQVPNVLEEIRQDPSFRTRLRLGYSQFPSTGQAGGVNIGVEDVFIGRTGLTVSGEYQAAFNGDRTAYGADIHYYVRPLGSYINIAPVVGYRYLETDEYSTDGVNLGLRLLLVLSRGGAADIALTQSFVSPGNDDEVGLTTLTFGYAFTRNLRLSTDIQKQNARKDKDSRVGIVLEWMP